jgi:hypothetical protein
MKKGLKYLGSKSCSLNTVSKDVIRDAFNCTKDLIENTNELFSDSRTFRYKSKGFNFLFDVDVIRDKSYFKGNLYVDGGVFPIESPNHIYISIYVNQKKAPQIYTKLYAQLHDVVRHEVQHLTQIGPNKRANRCTAANLEEITLANENGRYSYSMLPSEIEALVYGFLFKAKFERLPINVVFKQELNIWLKAKEINKEEYKKLYDVWMEFTKKHISTAKIN